MTDEQLADVLLEILDDGMFNDIYMRGDHNKKDLKFSLKSLLLKCWPI